VLLKEPEPGRHQVPQHCRVNREGAEFDVLCLFDFSLIKQDYRYLVLTILEASLLNLIKLSLVLLESECFACHSYLHLTSTPIFGSPTSPEPLVLVAFVQESPES
jgi:hypothetical protein